MNTRWLSLPLLLAPLMALAAMPVKQFDPVGTGVLTVDGVEHRFALADCRFGEEQMAAGMMRDAYLLGAGELDNQPFFVEGALLRRDDYLAFRLVLTYAPLFAAYDDTTAAPEAVAAVVSALVTAEALEASPPPETVLIDGRRIEAQAFEWQAVDGGARAGTVEVDCGGD